jgi:hypothetical protein
MSNPEDVKTPKLSLRWLLYNNYHLIMPCLIFVAYASPLVAFQLPNTLDPITESYEPLKTLKFVHSKGQDFHKWGPMTNFVYAPAYAVPLAYWKVHGDLGKVSLDFPYGFEHPFEQIGDLILIARLAGLAVACACTVFYGAALARLTGSKLATCLALTLCMATSPELIRSFASTKPDGLMLAFLAGAMGAYTLILSDGLTRGRGFLLSLLAVCSLSCKELTATLFVPLYAMVAIRGLMTPGEGPGSRRRFLIDYAFTVAVGIVAYALINVVYSPSSWHERMVFWLWGEGKDAAVWAPPDHTWSAYLMTAERGFLFNLGFGGLAVVAVALLAPVASIRNWVAIWFPSLGYLAIIIKVAGYMPKYFLSPLNVTLTLPVAVLLASAGNTRLLKGSRLARALFVAFVATACLANAWSANIGWINVYSSVSVINERYCVQNLGRGERVHIGNIWARTTGSNRLTYLGFDVDDRGLNELASGSAARPDVILMDSHSQLWIEETKRLPARAKLLASTGADYRDFPGIEALGYRLDRVLKPEFAARACFDLPVVREVYLNEVPTVSVYRRSAP